MSEDYDPTDDGTESGADGALSTTSTPSSGALGVSAPSVDSDSPLAALKAATARLKAQRSGLSTNQQLAALLIGFGQPSAHAGWQSGVVNAATNLQARELAQAKVDQSRDDLITKYDLASAHYQAQNQASTARTAELAQAAKDKATASAAKAAAGTAQIMPPNFPGDVPRAFVKVLGTDGQWTVKQVPVGTPGATTVGGAPPPAMPQLGDPRNPYPTKVVKGSELMSTLGMTGLNPDSDYSVPTTGPEAGKPTEMKSGDALAKYNIGNLTGPAVLAALPPSKAAEVQALLDGRLLAPTTGTRGKDGAELLQLATAADPTFDASVAKTKFQTRTAFAPDGKAAQNIIKGGTAIDHAVKLYDSIDALGNLDLGPLSGVVNGVKNTATASNNPAIKAFRANRDQFVNELEAAIKGTGNATSLAAFREWQKTINDADAPDVQKAVLRRGVGLLGERLQNQVQPYNQIMGTNRSFLSWLPAGAQQAFTRINPDYTLTDDDKSYLVDQERSRRATQAAKAAPAPGPSSATGGKALPASTLQQYQQVPDANKPAARKHLQDLGYDISGIS